MTSAASSSSSNVRVFIRWDEQTVFAGEEIKCTITFKNIAPDASQRAAAGKGGASDRKTLQRVKPSVGLTPPTTFAALGPSRGHRPSLSLSAPAAFSRGRSGSAQWPQLPPHPPKSSDNRGHSHRRSISIVTVGAASATGDDALSPAGNVRPQRPGRGHGRASSLQISPRAGLGISGPHTAPNTPMIGGPSRVAAKRSPSSLMPEFKFPMSPSPLSEAQSSPATIRDDHLLSPKAEPPSALPRNMGPGGSQEPFVPAMRILSTTSMGTGTPRSSGEFYNMSNHSSETLASDYPTAQHPLRGQPRPPHFRRSSNMNPNNQVKVPESIMMAYAQVQGSFVLDGSLINLNPFEQVKRKAAVGGQGGGVIGVDTSKRDSGLLRSFGWGSFGNSLGELLGTGELSSIKDMRGIASSKSIPLLSTPQSILFVDLNLAPGESKSYEYSFQLPRGLPPSHRGKAVKISYSLVIGTQRAGGNREQQVRTVEIPFRVLGSVNSYGEILGYDLMNPYIILRDQATIKALDKPSTPEARDKPKPRQSESTLNEFLIYADELLNNRRQGSHAGLLSPTAGPSSRRPSAIEEATTAKDAINLAVLRSTYASEGGQSPNRFEIARNGQRVGVVTLSRAAYRLGEAVTMVVDFSNADIPCYAVHFALESAERIADPHLALRSDASVHRVTRKVHSTASDAALYARRLVFSPTIPITGTPEFVTSGVALEWKVRVEFVVPGPDPRRDAQQQARNDAPAAEDEDDGDAAAPLVSPGEGDERKRDNVHSLLEEISRDERGGLALVAVENLSCESFEVAVPLRVYGAFATGLEKLERDEASEEGLIV
ncbi:Rgp1-domain-containing protein [Plectosphaerella plurivora]|uniref:Rgp1-domain-containing protein n=1 Tax=Plectosphaerella plurivora TaxID=936078 RepID=A0A9P9ACU0_9PEZI|nr:Rgp1-domain-containing protein [Plectosphaerella plurivora]